MTESRFDDRTCSVCRRPATGYGYLPKSKRSGSAIAWVCDDRQCLETASLTYGMAQATFGRLDAMAAVDGGADGGAYLDRIGKTDLATLTEAEWDEFVRSIIAGYRVALKVRLRDEAPF